MSGSLASRRSRRFCLWPLHASQARFIHLAVSRDPEKPFPAKPSASKAIESSHQTMTQLEWAILETKPTKTGIERRGEGRSFSSFPLLLALCFRPTSTAPLSRSPREKETHKMMFCRAQQQQSQPQQQQHQQPQPQRLAPTLFSEARADHAEVVARVLRANPAAASVREAATGGTALHAACAAGALAAVRALLAAPVPARLDAVDDSGDTPLHCAARGGHAECIEELLSSFPSSSSALARRRNAAGRCPLHEAAACCSHAACKALLSAGARRSALDAEGMTAADLVPRGADSTEAAVLYAMVLSGRSASVAERALCSFGAAAAAPAAAAAAAPAAGGSSSNLLLRRRDSRPWVAAAAARIASSSSSRKPAAAAGTQQQQQHQQLPARQQLRVVASASTDYGGESPAAPPAPGPAAPSSCAAAAAASAAAAPSPSAAAAGLFAESCSSLFVGARSVKGAPGASSSSSAAAAAASASPALRVAAAERRVEEVVDVVSRLAAAVEGTRAAVEADREAARREVAALRDEARERAAAADEALAAVDGRLASLLREEEETKAARAAKAAVEEEEAVAAAAAAAASYSSDDSATSYETAPSGTEAAEANDPSSASSSTSLPSPFPSSSSLSLSTEFAPEHLLRNALPSFAHVPRSVDGLRGALASLERRVARGEEWDAAASGFARSVGLELEKLQIEVSESARARLMGEARLDAAERGVEMLHGYLKTAAVALGPEAVEDARKRGAALSAAAATLANEKKARKAMEEELRRVKEACRELQGRLDEVEKEKGREAPAPAARAAIASEASAACASASGASAPARPRNRRRSSFLGGLFKPSTAVSRLGKGERRRLSSCSGAETNGLALAMTAAAARGGAEEEEVRVVVEEAE